MKLAGTDSRLFTDDAVTLNFTDFAARIGDQPAPGHQLRGQRLPSLWMVMV